MMEITINLNPNNKAPTLKDLEKFVSVAKGIGLSEDARLTLAVHTLRDGSDWCAIAARDEDQ